jgi:hypothetical protein
VRNIIAILIAGFASCSPPSQMPDQLLLIPNYKTSWFGNTWPGGTINSPTPWVQNYIDEMVVREDGHCLTASFWDEAGNSHGEYWWNGQWNLIPHREADAPRISNKSANILGKEWKIVNGFVFGPNGEGLNGVVKAVALGIYRPKNYLMVADDGASQHVIKFFDVSSGNAVQVKTFGQPGGIGAGIPGQITPMKFWAITGCGSDSAGNLYVSMSQEGVILRRYQIIDPNGLGWSEVPDEAIGLHFMESTEIDRTTDGLDIWSKTKHYQMDYSQPPGKQAKLVGHTLDTDIYPNDPRAKNRGSIKVRYRDGKRFMFFFDQNAGQLHIYRFNGEIAVLLSSITDLPHGVIGNVDDHCNVWSFNESSIELRKCTGVDASGNLIYSPKANFCPIPQPFTAVSQLLYDAPRDIMYLAGGTQESPTRGWGHMAPVVAKYKQWSTSRILAWKILVPFRHADNVSVFDLSLPMSWDYAGDRLYIGYLNRDQEPLLPSPYNDSPGWIRVYNTINGQFEGRLLPGREVLYGAGGLDIYHAISAFQRSNGDHVITREEDWKNKAILFVYKPETTTPEEPIPIPTPTSTPTSTTTPTSTFLRGGCHQQAARSRYVRREDHFRQGSF